MFPMTTGTGWTARVVPFVGAAHSTDTTPTGTNNDKPGRVKTPIAT